MEQSILLLQQNILLLQQQVKGAEEAEEVFVREVEDGRKREEALSARIAALERMGEEAQTLVQRAREEGEAAERLKVQVSSLSKTQSSRVWGGYMHVIWGSGSLSE